MRIIKLIWKNMLRHKLRTSLTILGIAIAVMAFGLMRTVVSSWNSGVEASAANRMVTVHKVSFIFPLPLAYRDQIAKVPGVKNVSFANWFQGIYIDENQFFARLAVDPETVFDVFPEFVVSDEAKEALKKTRNGCIIGTKLVKDYKLNIGDVMNVEGDIYPGKWQMQVVGIILLVLANTMVMTARERMREYAVMKTLGFSASHLVRLIAGESLMISCIGGAIGLGITFPICSALQKGLPTGWFPVFTVETITIVLAVLSAILAGIVASAFPINRAVRMKIVDGLRQIG